jgi:myosin heavy subunit
MITVQEKHKNSLNCVIHVQNVGRAILNTFFDNTVRRVNKCLETGGGHFEHYL